MFLHNNNNNNNNNNNHISVMELGHLLTRSGITCPEASSKFYRDSFCQLGSSMSLEIDNELNNYLKITGILNNVCRPQKTLKKRRIKVFFIFIPCKKIRYKVKQPSTCTRVFCF
jgi:hypothetical protein